MEALNVPSAESSVVTFWQGEVRERRVFAYVHFLLNSVATVWLDH